MAFIFHQIQDVMVFVLIGAGVVFASGFIVGCALGLLYAGFATVMKLFDWIF